MRDGAASWVLRGTPKRPLGAATTMPSRKKKHQRELKRKQRKHEREQHFRESHPFADTKVVFEPPGVEKMSEVILEFLDPYIDGDETPEKLDRLVSFGVTAWNAALVPAAERDKLIQKSLAKTESGFQQEFLHWFGELIRRKETAFPDNKRFIISYQLTMTPDGAHLSVISSFDRPS
jgi:hypothetical protein